MWIQDKHGNRTEVTEAHWRRWPQLAETFRPVAEKKGATVPAEPPTGDKTEEN